MFLDPSVRQQHLLRRPLYSISPRAGGHLSGARRLRRPQGEAGRGGGSQEGPVLRALLREGAPHGAGAGGTEEAKRQETEEEEEEKGEETAEEEEQRRKS